VILSLNFDTAFGVPRSALGLPVQTAATILWPFEIPSGSFPKGDNKDTNPLRIQPKSD